jgi:hypothetical protein
MNEQKILNAARKMHQEHILKIGQAAAGTNLKRRVNVARNYLKNMKKLQNYLYGGRSNVRNIQGFGRNTLANDINIAEQMYKEKFREYIHQLGQNVFQTARDMYEEHMVDAPPYNRNSTLTAKKLHFQRKARGHRRVQQYIQSQIRNEPVLAENASIKRILQKTESQIQKLNIINRTINRAHERLYTMKRKYPGAGPY